MPPPHERHRTLLLSVTAGTSSLPPSPGNEPRDADEGTSATSARSRQPRGCPGGAPAVPRLQLPPARLHPCPAEGSPPRHAGTARGEAAPALALRDQHFTTSRTGLPLHARGEAAHARGREALLPRCCQAAGSWRRGPRPGSGGATGAAPQPDGPQSPGCGLCVRSRPVQPHRSTGRAGPGPARPRHSRLARRPAPRPPREAPTRKAFRGHGGQDGGAQAVRERAAGAARRR